MNSGWSSLDIAKLIVSALTPIIVAVVGYWINRNLKRLEQAQWAYNTVTEKRLSVFDKVAPLLNDLLCYYTFVGNWRDLTPPDIIARKRKLDKIVNVNAPLFSEQFLSKYNRFMDLCFETYVGWGRDARLRTSTKRRKEGLGKAWKTEWDERFTNGDGVPNPDEVRSAYEELMSWFSDELGADFHLTEVRVRRARQGIREFT